MSQHFHIIPATTSHTLIFPLNSKSNQFDPGNYSPQLTDNLASYQEIQQVLISLNNSRKPIFQKEIKSVLLYVLGIFFFTALCFIANLFLLPYSSTLLFGIILLFLGIYTILVFFFTKYTQSLKEETIRLANQVLEDYSDEFMKRRLRWNIPKEYPKWVELCNDFRGKMKDEPIYIQPEGESLSIQNLESDDVMEISNEDEYKGRIIHQEEGGQRGEEDSLETPFLNIH